MSTEINTRSNPKFLYSIKYLTENNDTFEIFTEDDVLRLLDATMLKKYAKKAAVTGVRVSQHTFRHFFAVSFLRGGGDVVSLSRLLGHTSVETTQIYLKFTETDLHEKHEKASPVTQLLDKGNSRKRGKVSFK